MVHARLADHCVQDGFTTHINGIENLKEFRALTNQELAIEKPVIVIEKQRTALLVIDIGIPTRIFKLKQKQ